MRRILFLLAICVWVLQRQAFAFTNAVVVIEENHGFTSVFPKNCRPGFCTSTSMPNLARLIDSPPSGNASAIADNYDAIGHPSLPNYLSIWGGRYDGAIGQGCSKTATCTTAKDTCRTGLPAGPWNGGISGAPITEDDLTHELVATGYSWHTYAENYPGPNTCSSGSYAMRHVPPLYYADVVKNTTQEAQVVDLSQFATDVHNNALKQVSFIIPNLCDDAHDCSLATADTWLQNKVISVLFGSTGPNAFKAGGGGVLIVTFDEGQGCLPYTGTCPQTPEIAGGGTILFTITGPKVKPAGSSTTLYQHPSLTRLLLEGLGVTKFPGDAGTAPSMIGFFQ